MHSQHTFGAEFPINFFMG